MGLLFELFFVGVIFAWGIRELIVLRRDKRQREEAKRLAKKTETEP